MMWLREFINDNKYVYETYGLSRLVVIWLKLIGYLVLIPLINLYLFWWVWWIGILFMPMTYLAYVIAVKGQPGVMKLLMDVVQSFQWIRSKVIRKKK